MLRRSLYCLPLCAAALLLACTPQAQKPAPQNKSAAAPTASPKVAPAQPQASAPVGAAPALPPPPPPTPRYEHAEFTQLEGWGNDNLAEAWSAFLTGCGALKGRADWKAVCEQALAKPQRDSRAVRQFFEAQFEPWRVTYDDDKGQRSETGLITGYYEPLLKGSRKPGGRYTTPLHAVPDDLLTVDFGDLYPSLKGERVRARVQGKRVLPYFDRAALQDNPSLKGKEIVWVEDAIDAFFLQVQGSGRVQLPGGEVIRLAYADQNGQPYKSIGRYLVQKGELTVAQATAQGLRQWITQHPERLQEVLNANPSVVFFREEKVLDVAQGPRGALGVPLTAGRSVAVDARNLPLGAPLFLATTEPGGAAPMNRLVLAQDTGGAIRGVVRADFFWGMGAEAGERAGNMRQQGRMWLLWPKGRSLPPPGPGITLATTLGAGSAPLVDTQLLLEQVGRVSGKHFLVDHQVPAQLRLGTLDIGELSYPLLLSVLRNNALAAVEVAGVVNVVPEAAIRSYPLPTVSQDDPAIPEEEWVSRLLTLQYLDPAKVVGVLRPLVAAAGLVATVPGSSAIVVVDRYGNTRRLAEMLRGMDKPPVK